MGKNVFVSPHSNGWGVKSAGSSRYSRVFKNKSEALNYGRGLAINNHSELIGQKSNGRINLKNSYGNDPRSSKG